MENCGRRSKQINRNIFTFWALKVANILPSELNQFIVELINTRTLNIMVVGDKNVGKTSLIRALACGQFDPNKKCNGDITVNKKQFVDAIVGKTYTRINFFESESDTVGNIDKDVVKYDCILFVYEKEKDKKKPSLFRISKMQSQFSKTTYHIPEILCANKMDRDNSVDFAGFMYAKKKDIPYVRVSAKTFYGLDRIYEEIVKNTMGENEKITHVFW
jgi:GTPase SAR1 family protein